MLVGCYLAGIIPLAINLSEDKLKLVTVLGAGLLVGTALAVIIPEGIHAMSMGSESHDHSAETKGAVSKAAEKDTHEAHAEHDSHEGHTHKLLDDHSLIGITLVFGFIFMLLVDQLGGGSHMHAPVDAEVGSQTIGQQNRHKITATLGLVVHAAADGIAMGAAVSMATAHLTMIVFVAIMLHKAPAAFGLVSFLLHEGFDRPRIRKHLFVFAAAAPIGAIVTYLGLNQQSMEKLHDTHTTGVAMLFSAGTFLYVATVHVLPEIANRPTRHTQEDGTVIIHEHKGFKNIELAAIVIGAIIPVILSIGHKH